MKFLFQRNILSIEAADSILIAEKMGRDDRVPRSPMVDKLNATHVQTALCYKSSYMNVNQAFKIAGLAHMLSVIKCNEIPALFSPFHPHLLKLLQEMTKFDFIFYQNLMAANQFDEASIESIAMYRIYIE